SRTPAHLHHRGVPSSREVDRAWWGAAGARAMISKSTVKILLAVTLPFLFVKLGMPLLDPDEGFYAAIPLEMLRGGDWLVPRLNGLPCIEKPPLYFWLT